MVDRNVSAMQDAKCILTRAAFGCRRERLACRMGNQMFEKRGKADMPAAPAKARMERINEMGVGLGHTKLPTIAGGRS